MRTSCSDEGLQGWRVEPERRKDTKEGLAN